MRRSATRPRATGDELDEDDVQALWQRADGPYAPLLQPGAVRPLTKRPAAERPAATQHCADTERAGDQLAFDLAA